MQKLIRSICFILASPAVLYAGEFEPYLIEAGMSYYSDEYSISNDIAELGEEKNFEEVYQNYNYYEAVFNSQEQIVIFKAFTQGVVEFSETYFYDEDGKQVKKEIKKSDGSISTVVL
ncbi:MAG: hypothetical protein GY727_13350 [Gammaproteobacteria bacterium]|nr:hypothetical protein [Gammaproteobacteria bacterium]MCP4088271.1 hypothetical protein [Gammaproteobacteria bacterium]MCP4276418.1 hypothetical protein [Gammaproteobacteria bacterium]MCP4831065.1 hypothetical protein [Gammaproteobacteria bacterium]MCP4929333.1 hypothetical protein [Gammaproteobacteria bacterium]